MSKTRIALLLVALMIFSLFLGLFSSTVQAATINTSFQDLSITPQTAAYGQKITFIAGILPKPPSGYSYRGIILSVIDSNGNYRSIGFSNTSQEETGKFIFSWTPDIQGTYVCIITYQGETLADNTYTSCEIKSWFTVGTPTPTTTQTPIPLLTPKPSPTLSNQQHSYYPIETPDDAPFGSNIDFQVTMRDLPWYIIISVVLADTAALIAIVIVRHNKKKVA